jgi:AmmeMemoRadiSam system protein A
MISIPNQQALLDVARAAILATVTGTPQPEPRAEGELATRAAAFVSLHLAGDLRGCIGHLEEDDPLVHTVARCARLACTEDPRFPAVTVAEMHKLDVEISVLGPFERVTSHHEVIVGRHGLLIEHHRQRGVLLPQVATEYQWTAERFVEQTCLKAGLMRDGWRRGAVLWRFEAQVFGAAARG